MGVPTNTPEFGLRLPAEADTLIIEVTESQRGTPVGVIFTRTVQDRALAQRVRADLEVAMPVVIGPGTNMNCPTWSGPVGYTYVLRFFSAGALVERASGDTLSDCRFWTIQTRDASVVRCCPDDLVVASRPQLTLWAILHQETGSPLPSAGQNA